MATSENPTISRKTLIHGLGRWTAAAAGISAGSMLNAKGSRGKAIVIGAGMAGISVARDLRRRGFEVVVLEARNRIGGRIWTDRGTGVPMDMGAGWIEESSGNPLTALARKFGVNTVPHDYDSLAMVDEKGRPLDDERAYAVYKKVSAIMDRARNLSPRNFKRDISMMDAIRVVLRKHPPLTRLERLGLNWLLDQRAVTEGQDLNRISYFMEREGGGFDGEDLVMPSGYDQIPRALAKGLDIRLGHRVSAVYHSRKGVRIRTNRGTIRGDGAVITVPLGVLQSGSIRFSPALPSWKTRAMKQLAMGNIVKVALKFEEPFWPREPHNLGRLSLKRGEFPTFLNWYHYTGRPCLITAVAGRYAKELERLSDKSIGRRIERIMRGIFGRRAKPVSGITVARWGRDPFARGSYSYTPVGGAGDRASDALAQPVGRLFFAGEATIKQYPGTVHGAHLSGLREARRIAAL